jgi:hypothetical protein
MPTDQQEKRVIILAEDIDPNYRKEIKLLLNNGGKRVFHNVMNSPQVF